MRSKLSKRGVSLISLVVITIVLVMLSGLVTYMSTDMIIDSKKVAFKKNMETLSDAVEEYYAVNGDIPVLSEGAVFTKAEYESLVSEDYGTKYSQALALEIIENGDENSTFYEVDISKIGIKDLNYGTGEDENDIFLIANDSHLVYYLKGMKIKDDIIFSSTFVLD